MTPAQLAAIQAALAEDRAALHTRAVNRWHAWNDPVLEAQALQDLQAIGYKPDAAADTLRNSAFCLLGSPYFESWYTGIGEPGVAAYFVDLATKLHESHGKGHRP